MEKKIGTQAVDQDSAAESRSDCDLVSRASAGDMRAFDSLFVRHKATVFGWLWQMLEGERDQVEDAVGRVFLSAYRSLPRFRGSAAFSTWLFRIAVNEARRRKRDLRRWPWRSIVSIHEVPETALPGAPDVAAGVIDMAERRLLWRALCGLPEPYRTPTVMRYLKGMNSDEIGGALRRPAGTVRYQLSRAMRMLRERLAC